MIQVLLLHLRQLSHGGFTPRGQGSCGANRTASFASTSSACSVQNAFQACPGGSNRSRQATSTHPAFRHVAGRAATSIVFKKL